MKKTRMIGAVLAGIMAVTAVPEVSAPLTVVASAASKLAAPTGVKAQTDGTAIKLTWSAVKGADAYRVFKYNESTKKYEKYKNVTKTECSVTGLTVGTTYKFKIAALVKSGSSYTVQTQTGAKSVTAKLAAPKNIKSALSGTTLKLTWTAVKGADAYRVYMYNSKTKKFEKYKNVSAASCSVTGVKSGSTYKFKIAALVKAKSGYSVQTVSDAKSVTAKLAAPTGVKATMNGTTMQLTWNKVQGADAYRVYMYNTKTKKFVQYKNVASPVCNVTGLTIGNKYRFKIAALVKSGSTYVAQNLTNGKSATAKLGAPTGIKAEMTGTTMRLTWNAVKGADAYRVLMYNSKTKKFETYKNVATPACNVTGLTLGNKYRFKFAALVKTNSGYVVQALTNGKAATAKLSAPTGVVAKVSDTNITLTWNAVSGANAYKVMLYNSKTKKFQQYKNVATPVCNVTGLTPGAKYIFRVAAMVKAGNTYAVQTYTKALSATTKLPSPKNLKSTVSGSTVKLTWDKVNGAYAYRVYSYNPTTKKYVKYKNMATTSCTMINVKPGVYRFLVATLTASGGNLKEQMRSSVVTVSVSGASTAVISKEHVSGYRYGTTKYALKHDIEYMKKLSSDFIGWLQIKDTPIDLPVVQASNNEYYLTHTFYGENDPTKVGTTFADAHVKVTATSRPDNLVIYGHNIYTGVGLAKITNYYPARYGSLNFYLTHPTFTYESAYGGQSTYVVFAGMFVNTETKHGSVFNYYRFRNFKNETQFYQYFEQVFDRSVFYNPDLNIKYGDKFITLSTCFYPYGKDVDTRFVLFARELRAGEKNISTVHAYTNKSPLYFDYYYKVNGGKWAGRNWSTSLMQGYAEWKKKNP